MGMADATNEEQLTTCQAADRLNVTVGHVRKLLTDGRVGRPEVNGRYLLDSSTVAEFRTKEHLRREGILREFGHHGGYGPQDF